MLSRIVRRSPSPATFIALLALFVSLGGTAYAATGGTFILGHANSASTASSLTSTVATGPALIVTNTGGKPAAKFSTNSGVAPFQVNGATKVTNLNADKVDGKSAADFLAVNGKAQDSAHADQADSATNAATASVAANANALGGIPPSGFEQVGSCQDGLIHGWAWVTARSTFSSTYVEVNPNSRNCAGGFAQARRASTGTYFVRFPNNGSAIAVGNLFEVDATATSNSACADDYVAIDFVSDPTISGGSGPRVFRVELHDDNGGLEDCPFDLLLV